MNEVARAVEREFEDRGYTTVMGGFPAMAHGELIEDYRTIQRLLKEAAKVINRARDVVARDSDSQFWRELDAFLAELPEGYGNG